MSYLLKGIGRLIRFSPRIFRFIPVGIAGMYIFTTLIIEVFTKGPAYAFGHAGKSVFAAELVINENVTYAVMDSPEYTIKAFIAIVVSFLVLFSLVRYIGKFIRKSIGGNESFGEVFLALIIVAVMSMTAAVLIDGQLGFIPYRDSLYYLIKNIDPVMANIR